MMDQQRLPYDLKQLHQNQCNLNHQSHPLLPLLILLVQPLHFLELRVLQQLLHALTVQQQLLL